MDHLAALEDAWRQHLVATASTGRTRRAYVYASGRRSCVRQMALDLMHPEDERTPEPDALERMAIGKEREASIVARLMQIGPRCSPPFEVVEGQRPFRIRDRDGVDLIHGKIDGRLQFDKATRPVFEVKWGESFRHVEALEDLDRSPWTRHALDQLLSYLLAESEPWGFFILGRPGVPLFLRVDLEEHLERAERFLVDARRAVDAAAGGTLPDFSSNPGDCRRCPHFGKACAPPLDFGPGARVIDDPHLVELAEIREGTAEHRAAYERADKELKAALRGVEMGLLGPFEVIGRWKPGTKYDVPKAVKDQYRRVEEHGSFTLEIERVPERTPIAANAVQTEVVQ